MTHRIVEVKALENFVVLVTFQDGTEKIYNVEKLILDYRQFEKLKAQPELFGQVKVDVGGYGIYWNDELDLSAEEIWDNGQSTGVKNEIDIFDELAVNLIQAREIAGLTQKELSEKTHIYQGDISKIERGIANPSIKTIQRLAKGMGMKLKIQFVKQNL